MIDRQHPPDLYDLFRFGKADLTHNSELMRKLAVLFCSTMDHDLRSYSMERFVNIDDEAIEAIKHLLYPLLKLDLALSAIEIGFGGRRQRHQSTGLCSSGVLFDPHRPYQTEP